MINEIDRPLGSVFIIKTSKAWRYRKTKLMQKAPIGLRR